MENYDLKLERRKTFHVVVRQVKHGLSIRGFVLSLRSLRSSAALALLGAITEGHVSMYAQSLAVMSLQRVSTMLCNAECWVFSIAFHGASVLSSS